MLSVFGLSLGDGKSASLAVRELFQSLVGTAAVLPALVIGTPRLSRGGRWAVRVSVPSDLAKAIRFNQSRLAASKDTTYLSIYHRRQMDTRQAGRTPVPTSRACLLVFTVRFTA